MKFNPQKCTVLHISTNQKNIKTTSYILHGHTLEAVESWNYLGVIITSDLSWKTHVKATAAKAFKTLGLLRRNLREWKAVRETTYTGIMRPILEYASSSWDLTWQKTSADWNRCRDEQLISCTITSTTDSQDVSARWFRVWIGSP